MRLNKLGQGLAVSAVSALVVSGLALTAAPAQAADGPEVRLLSQQDGLASVRRDADQPGGARVELMAEKLDAGVEISFEFNADPAAGDDTAGWTPLAEGLPRTAADYAYSSWTPPARLVGTSIALRAVATTPAVDAAPATRTYATRNNVALSGQASPVHAVSLGRYVTFAPSDVGGFFDQPYADSSRTASLFPASGTTSATDGTVELSAWNPADGAFVGRTDAAVSPRDLKSSYNTSPFTFVEGGAYAGVIDITAFDAVSGDVLAVRAERDSDTVFPATLYSQTISSVDLGTDLLAGPQGTTPMILQVRDQSAQPLVGAEVRRSSDGSVVGYTDATGRVFTTQPNSTTENYYANTTDTDAFEDGVDVASVDITTSAYRPVATSTQAVLADGAVFDDREYAPGDVALQVVDVEGKPFAAEEDLEYTLVREGQEPSAPTVVTTDADGRVVVPFDPTGPDGAYTLAFTSPASRGGRAQEPVTFVAGDAILGLTPTAGTVPSGGEITYVGTLTVEGRALPGRGIDLAYTRGTEQTPGTSADAGIVRGNARVLAGDVATDDSGRFSVTVGDLVETGGPGETGGRLKVTARNLGDTLDATADFTAAPVVPTVVPPTTGDRADKVVVELRLKGADAGTTSDRLRIRAPRSVAGQEVRIHVRTARGTWRAVKERDLNRSGDASVRLVDRNGTRVTRYRVTARPQPRRPGHHL